MIVGSTSRDWPLTVRPKLDNRISSRSKAVEREKIGHDRAWLGDDDR
jgi:hypothetical protein